MEMEPLAAGDPRQVGAYLLHLRLGADRMGRVFLASSPVGRIVAVKIIHPGFARDPEFVRRFGREVGAAETVNCAYTAPVLAAGPQDDPPWLATEFVPGPSLAEVIAQAGPLPEVAVWKLADALVEALQALHASRLVHGGLNPANVLIAADGPRVIDFGIPQALEGTAMTSSSMIMGASAFMSPERAQGLSAGSSGDVFALGSVLAFAATGTSPFGNEADGPAALAYRIVHAQPDLGAIPVSLRTLVASCLAKAPADRPTLTKLMVVVSAASACRSTASPANFWPDPVAGLVSARLDSYRSQILPGAGLAPVRTSLPEAPTALATGVPDQPGTEITRTASTALGVGPLTVQSNPAGDSTPGSRASSSRQPGARRNLFIAGATAVAAIGVFVTVYAVSAISHPPKQPPRFPTGITVCAIPAVSCTSPNSSTAMKTEPAQIVNSGDGSAYVKDIGCGSSEVRVREGI